MSVIKRIATARQWNPGLVGGREDPEVAAMRSVATQCLRRTEGLEEADERPTRGEAQPELF